MKLIEIAKKLRTDGTRFSTPQRKLALVNDKLIDEAIAEAEVIEVKAEAFNRIRKYCTEELWNSILDEVKAKMKEEKE